MRRAVCATATAPTSTRFWASPSRATLGFDVMHYNLHKTFSTPHGGGGPGVGAVGAAAHLADYLPGPIVAKDDGRYVLLAHAGALHRPAQGLLGQLRRGWCAHTPTSACIGAQGLREISENAVLNANYLQARLKGVYPIPHGDRTCMHEFVAQGILKDAPEIHTMDIAKRLMDFGFHPPTVYFPLIVSEALMIEPTETESKETLDAFADAMIQIAEEARTQPELLKSAPHTAPLTRLDEVKAAKDLVLCYAPGCEA